VGASAMRLRNGALLREVIERHRLPFATTTMAKGLVAEDHPLSLGCIERARRQVQREMLRRADLIVGIGSRSGKTEFYKLNLVKATLEDIKKEEITEKEAEEIIDLSGQYIPIRK
jgi:thiamine pyrophosphate-dependent acetolactate synthase large subunit-like protein